MGKATWILAIAFIGTSIALTIIAAEKSAGSSVVDRITDAPVAEAPATPDLGDRLVATTQTAKRHWCQQANNPLILPS